MRKKRVISIELCMKWDTLQALNGNNCYQNLQNRLVLKLSGNEQILYLSNTYVLRVLTSS
jgi:adenine-specific DNA methylase